MNFVKTGFVITLFFLISPALVGQKVFIKPLYGYYFPRMSEVNAKIANDLDGQRRKLQEAIPSPGKLNGDQLIGGQIEYYLGDDYFMNLNVSFYSEKASVEHQGGRFSTPFTFIFEREVEAYDVMFNLNYYLGYNSWKRFNKYIGIGAGLLVVNAHSLTVSTKNDSEHKVFPVNTRGEFSGTILSGVLALGGNLRLATGLKLWAESGLQYGNVGKLDGNITTISDPEKQAVSTESSFDLTGLYLRGGIGFSLPFLK